MVTQRRSTIGLTVLGLVLALGLYAVAQQVEESKRARTVPAGGGTMHVLPATLETTQWGWLDPKEPPKLAVNSGDTVAVETMMHSHNKIQPGTTMEEIVALREAVGWDGLAADYPAAQAGYWATIGGFDAAGELVAWCAILSDGVRHAVLLDVIVHPSWQGRGIGRALVERATAHIRLHGITIIHVDFLPAVAPFYQRCGFRVGLGGIYEQVKGVQSSC